MGGSGKIRRIDIEYVPLPSQRRFHASKARFKGFSGPIGSGKSQALCQEALRLSYINAGRVGLLGAPTYPMLRDATQTTLLEILNRNEIAFDHNKAENTIVLKDTGSRILLRAVDEFERLRGTNLAWFGLDELTYTQEEAWLRLQGRLRDPEATRLCGFAVWTPKGYDWVYRKFVVNKQPEHAVILAAPEENSHLLERVPDFYTRLKDSYSEEFYRQECLGDYLSLNSSRVYSSFDRTTHVKPLTVNPNAPLYWALDFNVDPMCSVIVQIIHDEVHVLDEIVLRRSTTQAACEEFTKRHPIHGPGIVVFGDAAGNHEQTSGSSDYRIIKEHFRSNGNMRSQYRVPKANPAVRDRVTLMNSKLRSASGTIGMLIDPKCKELIQDFEQVCYKSDSAQVDKDRDRMRTHLSDALGYLVQTECKPQGPIGHQPNRLV